MTSRTGWVAVVIGVLGALTAADTLPMVTQLATSLGGPRAGQTVGLALVVLGLVFAKVSDATHDVTVQRTTGTP